MLLCRKDNSSQLNVINPETLEVEKHCGLDGELHKFCFVDIITLPQLSVINPETLEVEKHCELDGKLIFKFCFVEIITLQN